MSFMDLVRIVRGQIQGKNSPHLVAFAHLWLFESCTCCGSVQRSILLAAEKPYCTLLLFALALVALLRLCTRPILVGLFPLISC